MKLTGVRRWASGLFALTMLSQIQAVAAGRNEGVRTPVLLELFTSEGCSSCPPADRLLQMLDKEQPIAGADLIVLSEHVDYWNHSGWSDPYSSAAFSNRQRDYADKLGLDSVYTPQLIVDGTAELVGSNAGGARGAILKAAEGRKRSLTLSKVMREGDHVSLHLQLDALTAHKGKATIYVAVADNEDRTQVGRGENAGRALTHVAVVRSLVTVGTVSGDEFTKELTIPLKNSGQSGLRVVAFVQDQASRKVLAVTQQRL